MPLYPNEMLPLQIDRAIGLDGIYRGRRSTLPASARAGGRGRSAPGGRASSSDIQRALPSGVATPIRRRVVSTARCERCGPEESHRRRRRVARHRQRLVPARRQSRTRPPPRRSAQLGGRDGTSATPMRPALGALPGRRESDIPSRRRTADSTVAVYRPAGPVAAPLATNGQTRTPRPNGVGGGDVSMEPVERRVATRGRRRAAPAGPGRRVSVSGGRDRAAFGCPG
jgi:hypothetical protein